MSKQKAVEKMTKYYGTIEAARAEYRRLKPLVKTLLGQALCVELNGKIEIACQSMMEQQEVLAVYWL